MANFLSNLPAYRTGVSPLTRGVEVGLAHGFFLTGPFIKVRSYTPQAVCEAMDKQKCLLVYELVDMFWLLFLLTSAGTCELLPSCAAWPPPRH